MNTAPLPGKPRARAARGEVTCPCCAPRGVSRTRRTRENRQWKREAGL